MIEKEFLYVNEKGKKLYKYTIDTKTENGISYYLYYFPEIDLNWPSYELESDGVIYDKIHRQLEWKMKKA